MLVMTLVLLFVLGLFATWMVRKLLGGLGEASALALIAAPFVIYGISSGAVAEFAGFGVTAKFNKAANVRITDLAGSLAIRSSIEQSNFATGASLQACSNYYIIRDDLGKKSDEPQFLDFARQVGGAIKSAMLCGDFYGVVVLDRSDHFLGLFPRSRLDGLMAYVFDRYCIFNYEHCDETTDIRNVLAETELGVILKSPDVRVETAEAVRYSVQENESLLDIVKRPEFSKASALAVLQSNGKFVGLLPKQAVYDKLFAVLLSSN